MTHTVDLPPSTAIRELIEHWALDRDEERWEALLMHSVRTVKW